MNPVYLFIVGLFLCYNFGKDYVNKYLIFFFCLPLFWELLLSGHDIISFSFALFLMSLFSYKYLLKKNSFYNMLFLGILLGVLCTARVVLIFYPFILAFFLFKYQKKNSILLLIISVLSCGLLHLYFYAVNSCYQPMHLFQRGEKNVGVFPIFLSVLVLGIVMIVLYLKSKKDIISWNRSIMICFIIIFFTISIGELVENKFVLNTWEGVNYLFPIFPFLCFDWLAIASEFSREKNMKNENIGLHSNL
jgi:hypothetical protein